MKSWSLKHIETLQASGKIKGFSSSAKPVAKSKANKYGNKKVVFDGMEFDSKIEASRYYDLKLMVLSKEINNLRRQVEFELSVDGKKIASYIADFVYKKNGEEIVEDVKSAYTRKLAAYRLKKKMMKIIHGIQIDEL